MILAAGLGTRLRPMTDHTPKALLDVGGIPILERVARRLIAAGAHRLVINLHHLGDQIRQFVEDRDGFGVDVAFSEEPEGALETGGGVLRAAPLFRDDRPFFLHNADILTDLPLAEMYGRHEAGEALATLAVMARPSQRYLLFDDEGLFGRADEGKGLRIEARQRAGEEQRLGFAGVHVIAPDFPSRLVEQGAFSILDPYLRLVAEGARIAAFRIDEFRWLDIGRPEQLREAQHWDERPG